MRRVISNRVERGGTMSSAVSFGNESTAWDTGANNSTAVYASRQKAGSTEAEFTNSDTECILCRMLLTGLRVAKWSSCLQSDLKPGDEVTGLKVEAVIDSEGAGKIGELSVTAAPIRSSLDGD